MKYQICLFYSFCLTFHFPLILYICLSSFSLLLLIYVYKLSSKTSRPIWPSASLYSLLCISSLDGFMWMDKILLAQSCLDQEFLFILTSFSNLWLSPTLQSEYSSWIMSKRSCSFFFPKLPKFLVWCPCDYWSFEWRAFPLFPLTWVFLLRWCSSFLPLSKE